MVEPERCPTCHETDRARCTMPSECGCDHPEAIRDAKRLMADIMSGALLAPDKDTLIAELEARAQKAEAAVRQLSAALHLDALGVDALQVDREAAKALAAECVQKDRELARLRAAGTFNEGVEAAQPVVDAFSAALLMIESARAKWGATGFPVNLYPDPALWMERAAQEAIERTPTLRSLRRPDEGWA